MVKLAREGVVGLADAAGVGRKRELRWTCVALLAIALPQLIISAVAESVRLPTIDDQLRMEGVGRAVIEDKSKTLVYEWRPPYEDAPNLETLGNVADLSAISKLYQRKLEGTGKPAPLFEQVENGGYWSGGLSPDGLKLAVYSMVLRRVRAGIFDFETQQVRWFDFTPNYYWYMQQPLWVSNTELVYAAMPPGYQPMIMYRAGFAEKLNELWEKAFSGRESSATVLTTSSHSDSAVLDQSTELPQHGSLVSANVISGEVTTLGVGHFLNLRLSPDGRYIAGLRDAGRVPVDAFPHLPTKNEFSRKKQLVLFDLRTDRRETVPCRECDVLLGSLQWAADGSRLAFYTRQVDAKDKQSGAEPLLTPMPMQFFARSREVRTVPVPRSWSVCDPSHSTLMPIPLGRQTGIALIVPSTPESHQEQRGDRVDCGDLSTAGARLDWVLVEEGREPINLTRALGRSAVSEIDNLTRFVPVGLRTEEMFILAGGDVWSLSAGGKQARLTRFPEHASAPPHYGSDMETYYTNSAIPSARAVLDTGNDLAITDLERRTTTKIRKPHPSATLLNSPTKNQIAIFRHDSPEGEVISMGRRGADARPLFAVNEHLKGIARGAPILLTYAYRGLKLSSCAYLPPGYKPGISYPMIVTVYPDTPSARSCLTSGPLLHPPGYILLDAANPAELNRVPGKPLGGMTAVVLAAVDEVIREGYADPDRLGVFGFSQGHHAVLQIISETDRFKAAVVANGLSNFLSAYGQMALVARLVRLMCVDCAPYLGNPNRFESDGTNGLKAIPWENPALYVTNSPVFRADRIQTPLMIMHSDFDGFPLGQSEEIFSALARLGKDATYVTYWGEGHGLFSPANKRDQWHRLIAWWDRYLQAH